MIQTTYPHFIDISPRNALWISRLRRRFLSCAVIGALVRAFDRVRAWADTQRRPIFLGEFGTYEKVPMAPRTRWMSRVARVAEAHGFSWAYWQMDTDFAVYDFERDAWIAPLVKALVP